MKKHVNESDIKTNEERQEEHHYINSALLRVKE